MELAPDGTKQFIPCSPGDKGAFEATLITLAERGLAAGVQPPKICMRDFEKVSSPSLSVDAALRQQSRVLLLQQCFYMLGARLMLGDAVMKRVRGCSEARLLQ